MTTFPAADGALLCARDGSRLFEDIEYWRRACREGLHDTRMLRCLAGGHTVMVGAGPEARGWVARNAQRCCRRCLEPLEPMAMPRSKRGPRICDGCLGAGPCLVCGGPTARGRKTCSDRCRVARAVDVGRRALAALNARRAG